VSVPPHFEEYDDSLDDDCWNCGGEGFVSSCFEEWACVDPESGCDLCTRRCDVCRTLRTARDVVDGREGSGGR
jgi:hypothetical protein